MFRRISYLNGWNGTGREQLEIRQSDGRLFRSKVEGVCASKERSDRVYIVVDTDDPSFPSEFY